LLLKNVGMFEAKRRRSDLGKERKEKVRGPSLRPHRTPSEQRRGDGYGVSRH
jgi:hypothetical protein